MVNIIIKLIICIDMYMNMIVFGCDNFGIRAGIRSLGKVFGRKVKKMIVGSLYSFEF